MATSIMRRSRAAVLRLEQAFVWIGRGRTSAWGARGAPLLGSAPTRQPPALLGVAMQEPTLCLLERRPLPTGNMGGQEELQVTVLCWNLMKAPEPPRPSEEVDDDAGAFFSGAISSDAVVLSLDFGHQ